MKEKNIVPKLMYDTSKMNRDISIVQAIAMYTGIDASRKNRNIPCPSPAHEDKNPSARVYEKQNSCTCFACKRTLSPISLAKEVFPELPFRELCGKMLRDFNLSPYDYSNLGEIEHIENANKRNKFYDYFPVTESELKFIGLKNSTTIYETYPVSATDYYMKLYNEIPENTPTHDEKGNPYIFDCTRKEMIELGFFSGDLKEPEKPMKFPTLQELWREDKQGIERMIMEKCYERIENIVEVLTVEKEKVDEYKRTHTTNDIKEADKLREGYKKGLLGSVDIKITPAQKKKIDDLDDFEFNKDFIALLEKDADRVDEILTKVFNHTKQRELALKKERWEKVL